MCINWSAREYNSCGYPDETLSSRSYKCSSTNTFLEIYVQIHKLPDTWQNHCEMTFHKDIDLPTEYGKSCDSKYNKQG